MREVDADVVAVQELAAPQAAALAAVLPFGRLDPALDYAGMGIARRTPGAVARLPLPPRDAYLTEVALAVPGGGTLGVEVVNVHILAPHLQPTWWALAGRRAQLRGLEAHLEASADRPRVLVGDLNATPAWPLYRRLCRRLCDGARAVAANGARSRPLRTWGPWPGAPRLLRLDHVLVRGVRVTALRVLPLPGSDHSALVVDIAAETGAPDRPA